jgi:uncharacterized membrane protein
MLSQHPTTSCRSTSGAVKVSKMRFAFTIGGEKGSIVKRSIGYAIPGFLGQLLDNLFIGRVAARRFRALSVICTYSENKSMNY